MSTRHAAHLTFSLEALASRSGPTSGMRDGWGAAFYQGSDVAQFRESIAASDSSLVRLLEQQGAKYHTCDLAHPTCHRSERLPFQTPSPLCANWPGEYMCSPITDICRVSRDRKAWRSTATIRLGIQTPNTLFAPCWNACMVCGAARLRRHRSRGRLGVVAEFVADLRQLGPANFLYADGEVLFAHGYRRMQRACGRIAPPGLFRLSQQCSTADQSLHTQGVSVVPGFQAVTLIASVPLSAAHWQPFVEGEIVAVSAGMVTTQGV